MASELVYDYVIVGAGSAGCTLASRLTEDPGCRVLVIEAGGWDRSPLIHVPFTWATMHQAQAHDWGFRYEPDISVDNRRIECARGKVIGGCSSINAMAYARGHRGDYDRWAAAGLPAWSYEQVLPYFKKLETWEFSDPYRGSNGPVNVQLCRYDDPLVNAFAAAGLEAGYRWTEDYNGKTQEGFARLQMTINNGRRCSAATAYLHPALARSNLDVRVNALASQVIFEKGRATGVKYHHNHHSTVVRADREIILSCGVFNTPQLLMLSGIGDPKALSPFGIATHFNLRGVGNNLQDQMSVALQYQRKGTGPLLRMMRADRIVRELARTYLFGSGFGADVPGGITAFLRTEDSLRLPNVQLLLTATPFDARPYFRPFRAPYSDGFISRVVLLDSASRGTVTLTSPRISDPPLITAHFLAHPKDRATLISGLRVAREIAAQPSMQSFIDQEIAPSAHRSSDDDLNHYISSTAITLHHPVGTCRMDPSDDPDTVVDSDLKVLGVEGLRVVDASVMPDFVRGNINGPVIMTAEKAADLIRGIKPPHLPSAES